MMPLTASKMYLLAVYSGQTSLGNIFEYLCTPLSIKPNCRADATGDDGFLNIFKFKPSI